MHQICFPLQEASRRFCALIADGYAGECRELTTAIFLIDNTNKCTGIKIYIFAYNLLLFRHVSIFLDHPHGVLHQTRIYETQMIIICVSYMWKFIFEYLCICWCYLLNCSLMHGNEYRSCWMISLVGRKGGILRHAFLRALLDPLFFFFVQVVKL